MLQRKSQHIAKRQRESQHSHMTLAQQKHPAQACPSRCTFPPRAEGRVHDDCVGLQPRLPRQLPHVAPHKVDLGVRVAAGLGPTHDAGMSSSKSLAAVLPTWAELSLIAVPSAAHLPRSTPQHLLTGRSSSYSSTFCCATRSASSSTSTPTTCCAPSMAAPMDSIACKGWRSLSLT